MGIGYYNNNFDELEMYQKLIQYWSFIFDRRNDIHVLDNMNFNISLYPEIISMNDLMNFHQVEPGYTSPDGYTELNQVIRELEYARLEKWRPDQQELYRKFADQAGLGCGNGCTNVMSGVLHSILNVEKERFSNKKTLPEVILIVPNYTVYAAQLSNMKEKVRAKFVTTKRSNNFLPTFDEINQAITNDTVAIIITYPNNPAQSTYDAENLSELEKIIFNSQEKGIYLIVDNIYQDLLFPRTRSFTEIFNLTKSLDYLVKVYGSSKDTPFYSGYRMGYWFGDPRLTDAYKYYISSTENSLNTYSLALFALNLYFKKLEITNTSPNLEDMQLFKHGVFGWSQQVDEHKLYKNLMEADLYGKYKKRMDISNNLQALSLEKVIEYLEQSDFYCDYINQNIGNVLFIKVNADYFDGTDNEFFNLALTEAKCGILPGNVFGLPSVKGEVWFRITLIHETGENIIAYLKKIETAFVSKLRANSLAMK